MTVENIFIGNDTIRSQAQLSLMRTAIRCLMIRIKGKYGLSIPLSVFLAMAASCFIEMGRARMPKVDMPWIIYDLNNANRKFINPLTIGVLHDKK